MTFDIYENADNTHQRRGAPGVADLGLTATASSCQQTCTNRLGVDPTAGCTSFTYYHAVYADSTIAGLCFGDRTGFWAPFYSTYVDPMGPDPSCFWGNVTSGQNDPPAFRTKCAHASDCSYNGVCSAGVCECHPQWMGKHCGQLFLLASDRSAGLQSNDSAGRVSSWGGSVLRGDDGTYHMWASEMVHNTGILVWMSNSRIRHAVSRTPLGPYEPRDVAFGLWGHEPTVARAPTGEYVLFWTAHFGSEVPCSGIPCGDGDDGNSVMSAPHCLNIHDCVVSADLSSYMSYATDPAGPWSEPALVPKGSFGSGDTNLAPIIRQDGSLLGLGRPGWVWKATNWRNLSTYTVRRLDATVLGEGEWRQSNPSRDTRSCMSLAVTREIRFVRLADPFLYRDAYNSSLLHALSHAGHYDASGGHVWSTDGGESWQGHNDTRAWGSLIKYTDGSQRSLSRRERPHLVFDERGVPVALTNGATDGWPCTYRVCPRDYCHTALQRLNQDEVRH